MKNKSVRKMLTSIGLVKVKPEGWVEKCIRRWERAIRKPFTPLVFGSAHPRMWSVSIAGKPNSASDACFDIDFTWVTKPEAEFKLTLVKPRVPPLAHQVSQILLGDEMGDFGFSLGRGQFPIISVYKEHSDVGILNEDVKDEES